MNLKGFIFSITLTALLSAFPLRVRAQYNTWTSDDWADYTGNHVKIAEGQASLEKSQQIGDVWEDVSLPVTSSESEAPEIEQLSDGCLDTTTVEPVSGPDYGQVCKSCDGGLTWTCARLEDIPTGRHSRKVRRLYEASGGTIYSASYDTSSASNNSGIWKSTDGGIDLELVSLPPDRLQQARIGELLQPGDNV